MIINVIRINIDYVRFYNCRFQRIEILWGGRIKSCLVQEQIYLLERYRYIEFYPFRVGMVRLSFANGWSSYTVNELGKVFDRCMLHSLFMALAKEESKKEGRYRQLFEQQVKGELLEAIRQTLNTGLALGNKRFNEEVENITGRRVSFKKSGRPRVA